MKRQQTDWEKIFSNHILDKVLAPRIHKDLITRQQKTNEPIKKWTKDLTRQFSQNEIHMASKVMKNAQHP